MITKDSIIAEILDLKPGAAEILMEFGMGCLGCPSAQMERLEDACEIHGINTEELLERLNS